jgi:SsrA-binding protein
MAKTGKSKTADTNICRNKRALHDYFIEESFEAGMVLLGWEVKSMREKKVQLIDSYVIIKDGEAWLLGCNIKPLNTASTHVVCEPDRSRKLLLSKKELARLFAKIQQKGYTSVCTSIYWKGHLIKCQVALAKGKQEHDKRNVEKDREWAIEKQRVVRHAHR